MPSVSPASATMLASAAFFGHQRPRRHRPSREAERLRALAAYQILDTPPEMAFDRLAHAAADMCDTTMAMVSLVDEHRQWFKASVGLPGVSETDRKIAFCSVAIEQSEPLEVPDATSDPRFFENPLVTGDFGLRFYAGAPLVTPGGHRIGTLCVLDREARATGLNERQRRLLVALAAQVVTELELRSTLRLMKAQQDRLIEREQRLAALQQRVRQALDSSGVSVWEWDAETRQLWFGEPETDGPVPMPPSKDVLNTVHPLDRLSMLEHFQDYVTGRAESYEFEVRIVAGPEVWRWMLMRGASIRRDANGAAQRISGTLTDIDERKRAQDRLQWIVSHDALTGLRNRSYFQERLQAELRVAAMGDENSSNRFALVLLDLDHFKVVNDVYGHGVGDALLQEVARRLAAFTQSGEVASRLGGDEFTLLIPGCGNEIAVATRMAALGAVLGAPFAVDGEKLDCRASIGVSCYPAHGHDATTLLKNADIAMYRAKAQGRGSATLYRPDFGVELLSRTRTFDSVRTAISAGHLRAFYQAQLSLETGAIVGFEALLRIRADDGEYGLPPFMYEAFQDHELGVEIGNWMLRQVVADLAAWQRIGLDIGYVAINVSAPELRRGDYAQKVLAALAAARVPADKLQIEITESVFLGPDSGHVETTLNKLSDAGIRIAFDDFGTGFAALSHLKRFPIDIIKIDRSFIRDIATSQDDAAIVTAVIGLADALEMDVIAEGVETAEQVGVLRSKGCGYVQGFHFHRPMPADGIEPLLRTAVLAERLERACS